ncbi:MAG TPA: DUF507 family protein [Alphaproteobacteria bacterium]|nr:DUF507 family protein [Alphaproteobacteria bacterium]
MSIMSLSRPKINHLSHLIVRDLQQSGVARLLKPENEVRLQVVKTLSDELKIEEVIDAEVRRKLASYSRKILEGSREWDVMYQKFYEQEMKKRLGF